MKKRYYILIVLGIIVFAYILLSLSFCYDYQYVIGDPVYIISDTKMGNLPENIMEQITSSDDIIISHYRQEGRCNPYYVTTINKQRKITDYCYYLGVMTSDGRKGYLLMNDNVSHRKVGSWLVLKLDAARKLLLDERLEKMLCEKKNISIIFLGVTEMTRYPGWRSEYDNYLIDIPDYGETAELTHVCHYKTGSYYYVKTEKGLKGYIPIGSQIQFIE